MHGACLAAILVAGIAACSTPETAKPVELTAAERGAETLFVMPRPTTVIVHFVNPAEIRARTSDPLVVAYSLPKASPCEIYLPADNRLAIEAVPRQSDAWFPNQFGSDAIAHELLHCFRGSWHPKP